MKKHFNTSKALKHVSFLLALFAALVFFARPSSAQISISGGVVVQSYAPPAWAPPYDDETNVRYYYFPDYGFYYDVWNDLFWYLGPDGQWVSSNAPPPAYAGVDLSSAFIVLIDRDVATPWFNYSYYYHNYPAHGYEQYKDIVVRNRIVTNVAPGHELVPRAFNENTNRVTFMQRPTRPAPAPGNPAPANNNRGPANYNRSVQKVSIKAIAPSMPPESKNLNYGRGYTKPAAAPQHAAAPRGGGGAPKGGGKR